jgi:hypothetical protein
MTDHALFIEGVGFWAPSLPGWPEAKAAFCNTTVPRLAPSPIPQPAALPSAERRRAPETVSLALAVSEAAVQSAGCLPSEMLAVFTSAHGDLPSIDRLCNTLAQAPLMVSPTRFLHTIHSTPAGLWSLLAGNHRNHLAVSAAEFSFAAGLLEAAVLVATEQRPVLLVGYDTAATGALVHTTRSQGAIAAALVLSPLPSRCTMAQMNWRLEQASAEASEPQTAAGRSLPANGMSQALPLFEALAADRVGNLTMRLSDHQQLHLSLRPLDPLHAPEPPGDLGPLPASSNSDT